MERSLSLPGGDLSHCMQTGEDMLSRADTEIEGIANGRLTPRISRVLPLADTTEAHRLLEDRQTIGQVPVSTDN